MNAPEAKPKKYRTSRLPRTHYAQAVAIQWMGLGYVIGAIIIGFAAIWSHKGARQDHLAGSAILLALVGAACILCAALWRDTCNLSPRHPNGREW